MRTATVFELAVVVVGVVLFLSMAGGAYADATVNETVDSQTVTVNYSVDSQLDATDVVSYGDATVRNASGDVLTEGTDYDYERSAGEINWTNTANTTAGTNATATFEYVTHQEQARLVATLLQPLSTVLGFAPWLVGLGVVLLVVRSGGF